MKFIKSLEPFDPNFKPFSYFERFFPGLGIVRMESRTELPLTWEVSGFRWSHQNRDTLIIHAMPSNAEVSAIAIQANLPKSAFDDFNKSLPQPMDEITLVISDRFGGEFRATAQFLRDLTGRISEGRIKEITETLPTKRPISDVLKTLLETCDEVEKTLDRNSDGDLQKEPPPAS